MALGDAVESVSGVTRRARETGAPAVDAVINRATGCEVMLCAEALLHAIRTAEERMPNRTKSLGNRGLRREAARVNGFVDFIAEVVLPNAVPHCLV